MRVMGFLVPCAFLLVGGGCVAKSKYNAQEKLARQYQGKADRYRKEAQQAMDQARRALAELEALRLKYGQLEKSYKSRLQASQQELEELARARKEAEERARIFKQLTARFRKLIDAGTLTIGIVHGRMVLKLRSAVLFDSGKDVLKKKGQKVLGEIAAELRKLADRHFQVAGHTDNQPIRYSRFKSNWELSTSRAVRVVQFLQKAGVGGANLSAGGFSEYQPVGDNKSPQGRQNNRRIEISLLPSIPSHLLKM